MNKPLLLIITILTLTTNSSFNTTSAKCLLKILLKKIQTVENSEDVQIKQIQAILSEEDNESIKLFNDIKIMSDLNSLLINYDNLDKNLKNEINECNLNTENVFDRCEIDNEGNCFKINPLSYGVYCEKNEIQNQNYLCYKKCAEGFEDLGSRCKKPVGKLLKIFSNLKLCQEVSGNKCDGYMNDSFATEKCPRFMKKVFKSVCISQCEDGLIDDGEFCLKRFFNQLSNPYVFNFNDLFE